MPRLMGNNPPAAPCGASKSLVRHRVDADGPRPWEHLAEWSNDQHGVDLVGHGRASSASTFLAMHGPIKPNSGSSGPCSRRTARAVAIIGETIGTRVRSDRVIAHVLGHRRAGGRDVSPVGSASIVPPVGAAHHVRALGDLDDVAKPTARRRRRPARPARQSRPETRRQQGGHRRPRPGARGRLDAAVLLGVLRADARAVAAGDERSATTKAWPS